jgi:hypothetical protein
MMFIKLFKAATGAWLPALVFLFFYTVTTVIGALWFMTASGESDLFRMLGGMSKQVADDIGSPIYLSVLLLPFVITPAFAFAGIHFIQKIFRNAELSHWVKHPQAKTFPLIVLSAVAVIYCVYRLAINHALVPDVHGNYQENILRRAELFDRLGSLFFLITYGFLPILTVIFLARLMKGRKLIDLIGFFVMYLAFQMIIFDTLTKSHLLVVSIMLVCAVLIARASIWYIPAIAVVSVACYLYTNAVINGFMQEPSIAAAPLNPKAPIENPGVLIPRAPDSALHPPPVINPVKDIIYRMSSSFPFYIHIFDEPEQRCGIEANTVRGLLHLPSSKCILPIKVFAAMSPEITWVTGYAPAAANISAYGELGLAWSVVVMAISGLVLGVLGAVTKMGSGPLYVAFGVASCTFGYYLSQLPLIATFTYGHGLIFLTLPTILLFLASRVRFPMGAPRGI